MTTKLLAPITATGIHGLTGQAVDEGTLDAGTLVRDVECYSVQTPEGIGHLRKFSASTDGGVTWYAHESWDAGFDTTE